MAEIELKLEVPPAGVKALARRLAAWGRGTRQRMHSEYFDTAAGALAAARVAVRLRRIGTRWVQTLKRADRDAALARRGEWEVPAPDGKLVWSRFPAQARAGLPRAPRLVPVFATRFMRTAWVVTQAGSRIEVALDVGEASAGERRVPLCELEFELMEGSEGNEGAEVDEAALFTLARRLLSTKEGAGLLPQPLSKATRGRRLLTGQPQRPVKADRRQVMGAVRAAHSAPQALRAVIAAGSDALWLNVHGALADTGPNTDPEFVHQARVAVRRMRSAVRVLGRAAGFPAPLARELRRIGRVLGAVRDADVLALESLPRWMEAAVEAAAPSTNRPHWRHAAERRRAQARVAMRARLLNRRTARAALDLMARAHGGGDESSSALSSMPSLQSLAAPSLEAQWRRLRKAARGFTTLAPEKQHRVRIEAKRLRYALDLFESALPAVRTFHQQVARVQDALGALNDWAVAAAELKRMRQPLPAPVARRQLVAAAQRALTALFGSRPPWRHARALATLAR
jgi:inorganic triphosphatase YgiF